MRILVVGSEGFIGKHLVRRFVSNGYSVVGCGTRAKQNLGYPYINPTSWDNLDELFSGVLFDVCINVAGQANVQKSLELPVSDFDVNCRVVISLLDSIRRLQPACKFLQFSSAAVYGNPERLPIKETDNLKPISPYGWHKLMAEQICKEYSDIYGIRTAVVRPFSIYGVGLQKQLFWDLFQKYLTMGDARTIQLLGDGSESRDFISVHDVVDSIMTIIHNSNFQSDTYNIASGVETKISDAATSFMNSIDFNIAFTSSEQSHTGNPSNWKADISKLVALGFIPKIQLSEELKVMATWMKEYGYIDRR